MATTDEISATLQRQRKIKVIVSLLDYDFSLIENIEGTTTEYSFNIDASSDIRRTCSVTLYNKKNKYTHSYFLNKYVKVLVGIKKNKTNEYVYINMGIYLINNPTTAYSAVNNSVTIEGIDLMAKLTGLRNGNLQGIPYQIPMYSNIKSAMEAILNLAGFTNHVIEDVTQYVPYDITIDIGGTVYDILSQLRDILPNYQIYFDVDGVFHYNIIPSGYQEQISIGADVFNKLTLSSSVNTDYSTVKNEIEVFGKIHENCYIGGIATLTESTNESMYSVTIADLGSLANNIKIKFVTPNAVNLSYPYLKINALEELKIYDINDKNNIFKLEANKTYVLLYTSGMLEVNTDGFQVEEAGGTYVTDFALTGRTGDYSEKLTLVGTNSSINVDNLTTGDIVNITTPNDFTYGTTDNNNKYLGISSNYNISNSATTGTNIAEKSTFSYNIPSLRTFMASYAKETKNAKDGTYSIKFYEWAVQNCLNLEQTQNTMMRSDAPMIVLKPPMIVPKPLVSLMSSDAPMIVLNPLVSPITFNNTKQSEIFDIQMPLNIKKAFTTKKDKNRLKSYVLTDIHFIFNKTVDVDFFNHKYLVKFNSVVNIQSYKTVITKHYDSTLAKNVYNVSYYYTISTSNLTFTELPNWSDVTLNSAVLLNNKPFQIGTNPTLTKNTTYKLKFVDFYDNNYFTMLGGEQPYGIAQDTNQNSPFYINGDFGVVRTVLSGGSYDNIYSDSLAQERANWELYTRCKLQDKITITCVPIFYADVNTLIEFTNPVDGTIYQYIVKASSISGGVSGTQTLQCMRYYPYYET